MKILNLYSGIGGNRKLWKNENITSIEYNNEISEIYKYFFPKDNLITCDAHEYLRLHFNKYDFVWSSPPCQSHSSFRQNICVRYKGTEPVYPDMKLYQEILFLKYNFKGIWIVENVNPYYEPLIKPIFKIGRHLFWSNIEIPETNIKSEKIRTAQIPDLQKLKGFDLSEFKIKNKRQILRNCVMPEIGEYILNEVKKHLTKLNDYSNVEYE